MAQASQHAAAYNSRTSGSTRNPHNAAKVVTVTQFAHLDTEDRILAQWRAAFGCPVSDEAKAQFAISALGRTFNLSDVRLWTEQHGTATKGNANKGKIHLEFFFDGSQSELAGNEEVWTKAFENMIERQLQEQRVVEFRKKLATRRRVKAAGAGTVGGEASAFDGADADSMNDGDWQQYLKKPVPASEFSLRSFREAGCCLTFLVCQTSLSVGASEVLGQISFQEHFPIDGVAQAASASEKPLPRWVYTMGACTAVLTIMTLSAWYQVVRQVALVGAEGVIGAA